MTGHPAMSGQPAAQGASGQPAAQGASGQPAAQGASGQPAAQGASGQPAAQGWKASKSLRQLCGTVLAMEAIVIGLSIPVAIVLEHTRHGLAGGIGGGLAVGALLLSGLVGRPRMGWAIWVGTALQALVIAAGVVVPAMYALGVIFAALWVTGIWLARRHQPPPH